MDRAAAMTDETIGKMLDRFACEAHAMSNQVMGHNLLSLSRGLRAEMAGQAPGIPDLSTWNGTSHEGVLAWELMPELARRLIASDGIDMMLTREEKRASFLDGISAVDLRIAIGGALRLARFDRAAEALRNLEHGAQIGEGNVLIAEIVSRPLAKGNLIEIAMSRICPPDAVPRELRDQDDLARRIRGIAAPLGLEIDAWQPALGEVLQAAVEGGASITIDVMNAPEAEFYDSDEVAFP